MKQREIKFRAWVIKDKKMDYQPVAFDEWTSECQPLNPVIDSIQNSKEPFNQILMQYTGLKDKNGKEIYEGDIVSNKLFRDKSEFGIIKFGKYRKSSEDEWTGNVGFYIDWMNKATRIDMGYWTDGYENVFLEVIGNIYENSELIKSLINNK